MNEYLYELTRELADEDYVAIVRSHKRRVESEGEEDCEVICM